MRKADWRWSLITTDHCSAHLQIGACLFVSRRTMQTHVSHILTKLDLTSRTQVAVAVTRSQDS